jgi:hypothetical protein
MLTTGLQKVSVQIEVSQPCTADCPQRSVEAKRTDRLIAAGTFVFLKVWTGEQSSLLTRTATMESVSLFAQMKS